MAFQVHLSSPWIYGTPKTRAQDFFEAYAFTVDQKKFSEDMTQWYGTTTIYHSETGKVFRGWKEMLEWMEGLFSLFNRVRHIPVEFLELIDAAGNVKLHVQFRRQLWMHKNVSETPDVDAPLSWICTIGPTDTGNGFLGLQFQEVHLFWDKARTVEVLQQGLPSDDQ